MSVNIILQTKTVNFSTASKRIQSIKNAITRIINKKFQAFHQKSADLVGIVGIDPIFKEKRKREV